MRYGEQAGTVSVSRDALRGVEASLQQAGAHPKTRRLARHRSNAMSQRFAERLLLTARGRAAFLQCLPFERDAIALAPFQDRNQYGLFFLQIFLGIDPPVDREPALRRYHVKVCATAALPTQHQNLMASLIRSYVRIGGPHVHVLLHLLHPFSHALHPFPPPLPLLPQP